MGLPARITARGAWFAPETIELPTPLKVPPPQSKPLWSVVLIIGLLGLVGGMVWISFASGARSFTGAGSFFPILMVGGLVAMLFGGRGGSQEMSRSKLDSLRAQFCLVIDERRKTAAQVADRLDENYRWYQPGAGDAGSQRGQCAGCGSANPTARTRGSGWPAWAWG